MPDQTTDHLSGAKTALWNAHVAYQDVRPQSESQWIDALLTAAYPTIRKQVIAEVEEARTQVEFALQPEDPKRAVEAVRAKLLEEVTRSEQGYEGLRPRQIIHHAFRHAYHLDDEVPHQPLQPIDDKVEAFRKKFFERTGDRLQRTAVVEGLRAALGEEEPCKTCGGEGQLGEEIGGRGEHWYPCPDCQPQALEPVGEERVCSDCGREVEDGWTNHPWHCRYCGPRDEDETHIESVPKRQPEDERESTEEAVDYNVPARVEPDGWDGDA